MMAWLIRISSKHGLASQAAGWASGTGARRNQERSDASRRNRSRWVVEQPDMLQIVR